VSADDYINFVNEDREFSCEGNNARWLLPNRTEINKDNFKYKLQTEEDLSKLLIRKINANDIGAYRCVSDKVDIIFNVKIYCELMKVYKVNI
jgi:hypothetical protein